MKSNKSYFVLVPAIGSVSFVLSQWIMKSNNENVVLGLSSDVLGGMVVGIGFGLMFVFLRKGLQKQTRCK